MRRAPTSCSPAATRATAHRPAPTSRDGSIKLRDLARWRPPGVGGLGWPGRPRTRGPPWARARAARRPDGAQRPQALGALPTDVVNAADGRPVTEGAVGSASIVGPDP